MSGRAKRQAIPTIALADSTARLLGGGINRAAADAGVPNPPVAVAPDPAGWLDFPIAPLGHRRCVTAGGIFRCECGRVRMSRANLERHHDDIREERTRVGLAKAHAARQKINLREIREAYASAGKDFEDVGDLEHVTTNDEGFWT